METLIFLDILLPQCLPFTCTESKNDVERLYNKKPMPRLLSLSDCERITNSCVYNYNQRWPIDVVNSTIKNYSTQI